ncbi:MAG: prolyl oligopeptidase family serine peptidase, partial [Acidobacteria bacterium]|nr:prolyl oligopeptidase family serine peptidase [Acidobacteriota bacterium]
MRIPIKTILLFILFACAAGAIARGQQARFAALPVENVLQSSIFPLFVPISLSPDGQWVAFTLQDTRNLETPEEIRYSRLTHTGAPLALVGSDVWIASTRTGESRNLTEGKGTSWGPVWSPDGRYLAFSSDRGGTSRLWLWEKSSEKLRQLGDASVSVRLLEGARWTPDSRHIIVKVLPEGMTVEDLLDIVHGPREQRSSQRKGVLASVTVLESRAVSASRGQGQQQAQKSPASSAANEINLSDLAVIDIASGEVRRIARRLRPLWYQVSPDGGYVGVMSFGREAAINSQQTLYDLLIISLTTSESRVVASNIQFQAVGEVSWSPDSKALAYMASGPQARKDVFVASLGEGGPRNLTPGSHPNFASSSSLLWDQASQFLYSIAPDALWKIGVVGGDLTKVVDTPPHRILVELIAARGRGRLWSPDAGQSAVVVTRDEETMRDGYYKVSLRTGKSIKLVDEEKSYGYLPRTSMDVSADGQTMVYVAEDARHCPNIWTVRADLHNPRRVTNTNPQFDRYVLGASRLIRWRSEDGQELRGALLLPTGYREGKSYPLIVHVYGGELRSTVVNKWGGGAAVFNMQLLATRGYAVLFPDAPQRVGTPMRDLVKTVLPGVEKAVEMGIADPERLGVMGHSYGGYSTFALIVQSARFKAAVVSAGINNLMSAYMQGGATGGGVG